MNKGNIMTRISHALSLALTAGSLAACSTTSFAPPSIDYTQANGVTHGCAANNVGTVAETVDGAWKLIDIYADAYNCGLREVSNGRQAFDIPSYLATFGTGAAVALGANPDWAIGGLIGSQLFDSGSSYYNVALKPDIYADAYEAILCVEREAAGLSHKRLKDQQAVDNDDTNNMNAQGSEGKVGIGVTRQYFRLVKSTLESVNAVAAQRLRTPGSVDASALVSQLKEAIKAQEEAEAELAGATTDGKGNPIATFSGDDLEKVVELEIKALAPKLDQCVIIAKAG